MLPTLRPAMTKACREALAVVTNLIREHYNYNKYETMEHSQMLSIIKTFMITDGFFEDL